VPSDQPMAPDLHWAHRAQPK